MKTKDPQKSSEAEDLSNIWGWKFSRWGLIILILLSVIMYYRHVVLGVPLEFEQEKEPVEEVKQ